MKTTFLSSITLIITLIFASGCITPPDPGATETDLNAGSPDWELIWSEEFNGTEFPAETWTIARGNGFYAGEEWIPGWGNGELQYYTDTPENLFLADGILTLRARQESITGIAGNRDETFSYTSAKISTQGKASWKYGRFEIRAKFPAGKGLWPAIWMLPEKETYGGWAASGEIDIAEGWGSTPYKVAGTIHYGGVWPGNTYAGSHYFFPEKAADASDFHVYAIEWEPGEIRWYVDGALYQTKNRWYSEAAEYPAPFDQPFYLILNLAVGGHFDGNPLPSTPFPADMGVDYVRIYAPAADADYQEVTYVRAKDPVPEEALRAMEDGNLAENGNFTAGFDSWMFLELPQFKGDGELSHKTDAEGNYAEIAVIEPGVFTYAIQLIQRVPIIKGHAYHLEFTASADVPRALEVKINGDERRNWIVYSPVKSFKLTSEKTRYTLDFIMRSGTDLEARLEFNAGAQQGTVSLRDIRLYPVFDE